MANYVPDNKATSPNCVCVDITATPVQPQCMHKIADGGGHNKRHYGPGFVCTRPKGHDGPHIACGYTNHRMATWSDVETKSN